MQFIAESPLEENGYQIVHAIAGRTRIRIPWLETDSEAVVKLQRLIESLNFVSSVRVNPLAQSLVITYKTSAKSPEAALAAFVAAIQQVHPPEVAPPVAATPSPASSPAPAPSVKVKLKPPVSSQPEVSTPPIGLAEIPSPWDEPNRSDSQTESTPSSAPIAVPDPPLELWLHSTASLAKRLEVSVQAITRRRQQANFAAWTQAQDPEGIAWSYDATSQSFCPANRSTSPDAGGAPEPAEQPASPEQKHELQTPVAEPQATGGDQSPEADLTELETASIGEANLGQGQTPKEKPEATPQTEREGTTQVMDEAPKRAKKQSEAVKRSPERSAKKSMNRGRSSRRSHK